MSPTTPRTKAAPTPMTLSAPAPSAHYSTTRRHSLYGIEDRVVIDPGSRIWKVGFSGEGRPRDVFYAGGKNGSPLWSLSRAPDLPKRDEEDKVLEIMLERCLKAVFHKSLLTDPRARKVILVENPLLPLHIKDALTRILFENLQIVSVSFASSHLLCLLSVGRITGLVVDSGHLESTALPIFASRPLYPHLRTTPLAGSRLTHHLRALLLLFATYVPPPTSLSAAVNIPISERSVRVPQELLTDPLVEEIKTRCCFVGGPLESVAADARTGSHGADNSMHIDLPPLAESALSESESSRRENVVSSRRDPADATQTAATGTRPHGTESHLQALAAMYTRHSTATEIRMRVDPPVSHQSGTGRGTLVIPGWIRERAAEVLFEGGDVDESSVTELILDALLKVPVDLRKTMASTILCVGGTSMLPGFIPRLHTELLKALAPSSLQHRHRIRPDRPAPPPYDRYAPLRSLTSSITILNNPSPPSSSLDAVAQSAGSAPAFAPAMMPWIGGSLAGSLKTGGVEVMREKWEEANRRQHGDDGMDTSADFGERTLSDVLPDWTRLPLTAGALLGPQAVPQTPAILTKLPGTAINV